MSRGVIGLGLAMVAVACPGGVLARTEAFECVVEASEVTELGTSIAGVLAELKVERGDLVKAGQVVARLSDGVERASLDVARMRANQQAAMTAAAARKDFTARRYARARDMRAKNFVSEHDVDEARTEAEVAALEAAEVKEQQALARLEVEQASEILKLRTIRSPIDGVVVDRYFSVGERVEEKPILKIARVTPLHVEVVVPGRYFGKVSVGDAAKVTLETPFTSTIDASVVVVDRLVDAASGSFRVRLRYPNARGELPAGLACRATFPKLR